MSVGVIGSGKFGLTLSKIISENGNKVTIFTRRDNEAESINSSRKCLSGFVFDSNNVRATCAPKDLNDCKHIFITTPSHDFSKVVEKFIFEGDEKVVITCTKGLEDSTSRLMSEILLDDFKLDENKLVVLSGPNLASEILNKETTATVLAGKSKSVLEEVNNFLKTDYFIPYYSNDTSGVELAGALKNIYAIVSGYFNGMNVGQNTMGFLLTKSLEEMRLYSQSRGANLSTFLGLAGVGDFFSTALSPDSRNYQFGNYLSKGFSVEESLQRVGDIVEGLRTSKIVYEDCKRKNLNLKILKFLNDVYSRKEDYEGAKKLLFSDKFQSDVSKD